jgi:hypothetical protein
MFLGCKLCHILGIVIRHSCTNSGRVHLSEAQENTKLVNTNSIGNNMSDTPTTL